MLAADRRALVGLQRNVEAPRLVILVGEIFDGFVVQQAVDRLGIGLAVRSFISRRNCIRQSVTMKVKAT